MLERLAMSSDDNGIVCRDKVRERQRSLYAEVHVTQYDRKIEYLSPACSGTRGTIARNYYALFSGRTAILSSKSRMR